MEGGWFLAMVCTMVMLYAVAAIRTHFQEQANVYVAGNLCIYYEEGNCELAREREKKRRGLHT